MWWQIAGFRSGEGNRIARPDQSQSPARIQLPLMRHAAGQLAQIFQLHPLQRSMSSRPAELRKIAGDDVLSLIFSMELQPAHKLLRDPDLRPAAHDSHPDCVVVRTQNIGPVPWRIHEPDV